MPNYNQSLVLNGLGTSPTITVPVAGRYQIEGKIQSPSISTGDGVSAVLTLVKKNGSTILTGTAGDKGFMVSTNCAANDAITIVQSSSLAVDNALNAVKTTLNVSTVGDT